MHSPFDEVGRPPTLVTVSTTDDWVNPVLAVRTVRAESYDIFRRQIDGTFVWAGATETFARAMEKIVQDPASSDHDFLIVNELTGERMLIEAPERPATESLV